MRHIFDDRGASIGKQLFDDRGAFIGKKRLIIKLILYVGRGI
jgi:hypothetical protein